MRALVLAGGLVVSAVVLFGCSPPSKECSSATCSGCCDESGACQAGTDDAVCGGQATRCTACAAGLSCQAKSCVRTSGTGGGGAVGGGSGGGGGGVTGGGTGGGATGGGGGVTGGGTGGGVTGGGTGGGASNCPSMSPPTIPITFPATCPSPTACGGNPAGTFFYTAACVPQTEFTPLVARIEQGCGAGSVHLNGFDGGMAGSATFSGGNSVCRTVRGGVTVSATVTGTCASATICGLLASGISQGGYTGSCAVDAGACDCLVTRAITIDNAGVAYTVGATTLTVTSSGQTFETCLTGGTALTTKELDAGTATHEPGVATLTKQ